MRTMLLTMVSLTIASAACAQQPQQQAREEDPTRKVAGSGAPAGWNIRLDAKDKARYTVNDTKFSQMGAGLHVTSGPAALYHKGNVPAFTSLSATFVQMEAPRHPEAYGLFFGGKNIDDDNGQEYVYFLIRGDGQYNISHRAGAEVHRIINWTPNAAIVKQDSTGKARNTLSVAVDADSVRFQVNGTTVHAMPRTTIRTVDGVAGLRVNHNLNVHIDGYSVK
ncbi:MAG TPA: hypothetical protein VFV33_18365 [Gemmatimonadaceae bacterium]|nr:hypothetical protein [Gemmatimonadaceae bacterium]